MRAATSFHGISRFILGLFLAGTAASCSDVKKPALLRRITGEKSLDTAAFGESMQEALGDLPDTAGSKQLLSVPAALRIVYAGRNYSPLWLDARGRPDTSALLRDLQRLQDEGLAPTRYGLERLRTTASGLAPESALDSLVAWDTACTHAYLQASRDLLLGTVVPRRADSLWFHANDSVWDAPARLVQSGRTYLPLDSFRSRLPAYTALTEAYRRILPLKKDPSLQQAKDVLQETTKPDTLVRRIVPAEVPDWERYQPDSLQGTAGMIAAYQTYYGARATGKMDSSTRALFGRPVDSIALRLQANLERLRWLPRSYEARYVEVNVPMMELRYRDDGQDAFRMRVVVGKLSRQTPSLNANMANVVFNPGWGVPPTILKKDVLPGIVRSGASYLSRKGLKAYDRNGREVSAGGIHPGNYRNYTFRQPPGAHNALGEVKFNLPNPWDIYLHDTPHREDFPKRNRALSSGCVRVQKPKEFAEFILTQLEGKEQFTPGKIDSIIETRKTRYEILKNKIPVHIVYLTASEDGGTARFYEDIYRRDAKLMALLPH